MTPPPPRVLLVGGGHANIAVLKAARRWTHQGAHITLVNDTRHLYYSGMTPEHLGGVYTARQMRIDLLRWCLHNHVRFVQSPAVEIDVAGRAVTTEDGTTLTCDAAIFDIGARNPHHELAPGAVSTKPLHHTQRLEAWLKDVLDHDQPQRTLVVVGGGPAGAEVMLNVSERVRRSERPRALRLVLLHPGERLMPQFAPHLGEHTLTLLRQRGVDVRLNTKAARVDAGTVLLDSGERIPQDEVLWATGTTGHPIFQRAGLSVNERGYVRVDRTLRSPDAPWLLAAGDCAAVDGLNLDRSGVNAVKQGLLLRGNVDRIVRGLRRGQRAEHVPLARFTPYPVAPYLVSTGTPEALLALGPRIGLRAPPLLWLKHAADRVWVSRYHFPDER